MGIKSYKKYLIEAFPNIVIKNKPDNIHTLCIDANAILHQVCHIAKTKDKFHKILINMLKNNIKIINPSFVAIFTDGQAILAKAKTQIKRRNKYLYSKSSGVSSLNLTPGTPFMEFVDDIISDFLKSLPIKSFYSSSKENNEGEIKLFEWLIKNNNTMGITDPNSKVLQNKICICGDDSDLIVLALASRPLVDIYIYTEKKYLSLYKLIDNLAKIVPSKFNYNWHPVRMDFVLLSLFQGNDYNNRISQFNKLLKSYIKLQKNKEGFLVNKNSNLNMKTIKKLVLKIHSPDIDSTDFNNVKEYFKSIQWNINLYTGKTVNNFIPNYKNINITSIIKYMPNNIESVNEPINWLNPDVYTLLLMPSTGKHLLPERLQPLMNDDSPIKDLFPDPCSKCIEWKNKLSKIILPPKDANDDEKTKYKNLLSITSQGYAKHIKKAHLIKELPIARIQEAVSNL
jgi:hypothetical protein